MDKKLILAVAGSGKTTHIINNLDSNKRSIIVTYTNNNYNNLKKNISKKFGCLPENISLFTYFSFLYSFCYRPFLSYQYKDNGITFERNMNRYVRMSNNKFFFDSNNRLYSNRLAKFIDKKNEINNVKKRLEKYFDNFFIDEFQDLGGYDFNFIMKLLETKINILFVGDFYQHTYNTSRDCNVNKNLYSSLDKFRKKCKMNNLKIDENKLKKSYRCSPTVCNFIKDTLEIDIVFHRKGSTKITFSDNEKKALNISQNQEIIKLFYRQHYEYNCCSKNWGESKGDSDLEDVCVVLNKTTYKKFRNNNLESLAPTTKNKLYVACSRSSNNLFLVSEKLLKRMT